MMVHENLPPFDEKRWIGKGKIFLSNSSAFPDLEGYCKRNLFIPEDFCRYAVPNSSSQSRRFNDDSGWRFNGDSDPIHLSESPLNRM